MDMKLSDEAFSRFTRWVSGEMISEMELLTQSVNGLLSLTDKQFDIAVKAVNFVLKNNLRKHNSENVGIVIKR